MAVDPNDVGRLQQIHGADAGFAGVGSETRADRNVPAKVRRTFAGYGRGWDRTSDPSRVKRVLSR
jgi:hypothetical protein